MKKLFPFIFTLLLLIFGNSVVFGCTCVEVGTREEFKRNKIIFQGTVAEVNGNTVKFTVEKIWKGSKQNIITINAYPNKFTGECGDGFAFEKGEKYVVFIYDDKKLIEFTQCTSSFRVTSTPERDKFDKSVKFQRKTLKNLNDPLFKFWARIYPF